MEALRADGMGNEFVSVLCRLFPTPRVDGLEGRRNPAILPQENVVYSLRPKNLHKTEASGFASAFRCPGDSASSAPGTSEAESQG